MIKEFQTLVEAAAVADEPTYEAIIATLRGAFQTATKQWGDQLGGAKRTQNVANNEPAAARPAKATQHVSQTDAKDLNSTLGMTQQLAAVPQPTDFVLNDMLNRKVAIKWFEMTRGGWFIGELVRIYHEYEAELPPDSNEAYPEVRIEEAFRPMHAKVVNAEVYYAEENRLAKHALLLSNMTTEATSTKFSWGLVEPKDLTNAARGSTVLPPQGTRARQGRPKTKRLRPSDPGAPTSGSKRGKHVKGKKPTAQQ
jgi:hypothetical protein